MKKKINKEYKDITMEELEKAIGDLFPKSTLTYTELYERLLPGYYYHIDSGGGEGQRSVKINTGVGGARQFLRQCEMMGLPADMAAEAIYIDTTNYGKVSLKDLKVKKK